MITDDWKRKLFFMWFMMVMLLNGCAQRFLSSNDRQFLQQLAIEVPVGMMQIGDREISSYTWRKGAQDGAESFSDYGLLMYTPLCQQLIVCIEPLKFVGSMLGGAGGGLVDLFSDDYLWYPVHMAEFIANNTIELENFSDRMGRCVTDVIRRKTSYPTIVHARNGLNPSKSILTTDFLPRNTAKLQLFFYVDSVDSRVMAATAKFIRGGDNKLIFEIPLNSNELIYNPGLHLSKPMAAFDSVSVDKLMNGACQSIGSKIARIIN